MTFFMPPKPMLAVPMSKANVTDWTDWFIEEKYDGHRLIIRVFELSLQKPKGIGIMAWTRPRKRAGADGKTMAVRELPPHIVKVLERLPLGVYDGELIGGATSTDVVRTELAHTLRLVLFDLLELAGRSTCSLAYVNRRELLVKAYQTKPYEPGPCPVTVAPAHHCRSAAFVSGFVKAIWEKGGEGAIIKRGAGLYHQGKRSKDIAKIKKLGTAVMTVIGFEPSRGAVNDRGPFAIVQLRDDRGFETTIKTIDDSQIEAFEREWLHAGGHKRIHILNPPTHPAIGRKLRVEFQDFTRDGGYRHIRWDRWEDE